MSTTNTKPLLILDLDETLIHATSRGSHNAYDFEVGPYIVYRRPYLEQFFQRVSSLFDLAIWSSSSADYVEAITAHIVPSDIALEFQWSRARCIQRYDAEWQSMYWVKDLKKVKRLGYDLNRVLIVDDTPKKLERNYGNAIYISAFEGDLQDRELLRLASFLGTLVVCQDVRAVEKRGWQSRFPTET